MTTMHACTGTLLWFGVPTDDRFPVAAAILQCSDCCRIFVTGEPLDDRHQDSLVVRVD